MSLSAIATKAAAQAAPAVERTAATMADETGAALGKDAYAGAQKAAAGAAEPRKSLFWKAFDWGFTKIANIVSEREYGHPF